MADCVIRLDHRVVGQVATRRLRVIKYRGSGFGTNEYPYVIGDHGIVLFPLTKAELAHQPLGPKVSSGLAGLDAMLERRLPTRVLHSHYGHQRHGQDDAGEHVRSGRLPSRRESACT